MTDTTTTAVTHDSIVASPDTSANLRLGPDNYNMIRDNLLQMDTVAASKAPAGVTYPGAALTLELGPNDVTTVQRALVIYGQSCEELAGRKMTDPNTIFEAVKLLGQVEIAKGLCRRLIHLRDEKVAMLEDYQEKVLRSEQQPGGKAAA